MRLIVGLIVGISVFLSTGQALKCIQCTSYDDKDCNGNATECPTSMGACGTTLIRNRGFRWTSFFQIKSCVDISECFNTGRVTGLYMETSFNTLCCFNDSCKNALPTLPEVNLTLNGLLCPSYVDTRAEPYDIKNVSVCTGNQNRCVRYSTTTTLGSSVNTLYLGGCASQDTCVTEKSYVSGDGISFETKRACYNNACRLAYTMPVVLLILRTLIGSLFSL